MKKNNFQAKLFASLTISLTCVLSLSGCFSAALRTTGEGSVHDESIQVRKQIKDVDYRTGKAETEPKKRVVVLPFLDKQAELRAESVRKNAHEAFLNEINKSEKVVMLDASQLTVDVSKYNNGSEYDLNRLAKDSAKSGVSSIIEGQIIEVRMKKSADQVGLIRNLNASYEVVVRMRIVNVRSLQEIFHTVKTVTLDEANTRIAMRTAEDQFFIKNPELVEVLIKDAFLDFTAQIQEALGEVNWEGRIAAVKGEKIYINVGRISGVQIGDILKVVEDSSEIYDPEIGYNLGKIQGRVKGTLEVVSYFGNDGAVSVVHSGAGFKESDRVELYR